MSKSQSKDRLVSKRRTQVLTVASVNWKGHLKRLRLEPGMRYLTLPLSACVSGGDTVRLRGTHAWVVCKNGEAQILGPYVAEDRIMIGGLRPHVLVKEVTEEEEHAAYYSEP